MPKPDPRRISAYGMIKRASVIASLPPEEQDQLERLEARQRLSAASEARLQELWAKAFDAHVPPQVDPLFAYAEEVGARMRARLREQDQEER
jgi:hypothetical protein